MDTSSQRERAERFLRLHDGPDVLVVGSAWDPGSAVLFEREGFEAIATSSAGVAYSLGYPDGERIPRDEMLAAVARIVRATRLPVSADVEMGYGRSARGVGWRRVSGGGGPGAAGAGGAPPRRARAAHAGHVHRLHRRCDLVRGCESALRARRNVMTATPTRAGADHCTVDGRSFMS